MIWSRVQHNGLLKNVLPSLISSMVWEGVQVVFLVLPVRGKSLGRSGYLQWINMWCVARVTDRSLTSAYVQSFWRSKDFNPEQDPSGKVWQECLQQASNLVRTAWNWVSWGKFVITYREVKAQWAMGKWQHYGEDLCTSLWTQHEKAPFKHLYANTCCRGNRGEFRNLCRGAELCFHWDICGEIAYMTGVLHMWGYRLFRKDKSGRQWGRLVLCANGWKGDKPVDRLWIMIRGCFNWESSQTVEEVTKGVVGPPSQEVLRTPLGASRRGVDHMASREPIQNKLFCD